MLKLITYLTPAVIISCLRYISDLNSLSLHGQGRRVQIQGPGFER